MRTRNKIGHTYCQDRRKIKFQYEEIWQDSHIDFELVCNSFHRSNTGNVTSEICDLKLKWNVFLDCVV